MWFCDECGACYVPSAARQFRTTCRGCGGTVKGVVDRLLGDAPSEFYDGPDGRNPLPAYRALSSESRSWLGRLFAGGKL